MQIKKCTYIDVSFSLKCVASQQKLASKNFYINGLLNFINKFQIAVEKSNVAVELFLLNIKNLHSLLVFCIP